jgi:hypothetical protein
VISKFVNTAWLFWTVSIALSSYYAYRGWLYERYDPYVKPQDNQKMSKWDRRFLLNIHGSIYNFIASMAGFFALKQTEEILRSIGNLHDIGIGTAALVSFLTLVAILGISGVLPRFFWRGALLGTKQ